MTTMPRHDRHTVRPTRAQRRRMALRLRKLKDRQTNTTPRRRHVRRATQEAPDA